MVVLTENNLENCMRSRIENYLHKFGADWILPGSFRRWSVYTKAKLPWQQERCLVLGEKWLNTWMKDERFGFRWVEIKYWSLRHPFYLRPSNPTRKTPQPPHDARYLLLDRKNSPHRMIGPWRQVSWSHWLSTTTQGRRKRMHVSFSGGSEWRGLFFRESYANKGLPFDGLGQSNRWIRAHEHGHPSNSACFDIDVRYPDL